MRVAHLMEKRQLCQHETQTEPAGSAKAVVVPWIHASDRFSPASEEPSKVVSGLDKPLFTFTPSTKNIYKHILRFEGLFDELFVCFQSGKRQTAGGIRYANHSDCR
jgi:hypothetical protein